METTEHQEATAQREYCNHAFIQVEESDEIKGRVMKFNTQTEFNTMLADLRGAHGDRVEVVGIVRGVQLKFGIKHQLQIEK